MGGSFDRLVVAAFRGRSAAELAAAPPDALHGLSAAGAARVGDGLRATTVGRLAASRVLRAASTIERAAGGVPAYDPGPPPEWERMFARAPFAAFTARPDLFRVDFGPVFYRGRLDGTARILVVGQDPSVNEQLARRAFVGSAGQRLQGLLAKVGITRSYLMLNTFLYCIFDQFGGQNEELSHRDPILRHRNALFDLAATTNPLEAVLTVGAAARAAVDRWPGVGDLPRIHVLHPSFRDAGRLLADWNRAVTELQAIVEPDDGSVPGPGYGTGFVDGDSVAIPRADLPFGVPDWLGVGDHAKRRGDSVIEWHAERVDG